MRLHSLITRALQQAHLIFTPPIWKVAAPSSTPRQREGLVGTLNLGLRRASRRTPRVVTAGHAPEADRLQLPPPTRPDPQKRHEGGTGALQAPP